MFTINRTTHILIEVTYAEKGSLINQKFWKNDLTGLSPYQCKRQGL
jgi:hypothetical protein